MATDLSISAVARRAGVRPSALRYYERDPRSPMYPYTAMRRDAAGERSARPVRDGYRTRRQAHVVLQVRVVGTALVDYGPGVPLSFIEADRPYLGME